MQSPVYSVLKRLASLKLSVVLLSFSLALVFFGTLDQVQYGIRQTQALYFESFFVIWKYPPFWAGADTFGWLAIPLPGGYLVGPLLALNMTASFILLLRAKMKLLGIHLIHLGIIILLVGQLVTQLFQEDSYMWLEEGETKDYITSFHRDELFLKRYQQDGPTSLISIPAEKLRKGKTFKSEPYPFDLKIVEFYPNARVQSKQDRTLSNPVTRGIGKDLNLGATALPLTKDNDARNATTAVVTLSVEGEPIGTWMVSNLFESQFNTQTFRHEGDTYEIGLRFKRRHLNFTLFLEEFHHDKYPGTNIPRNYASDVVLKDRRTGEERDIKIYMNNPLRYDGLTFFQASFAKQDTASMFQVVKNPGWLIPYISCALVSLGLFYQFGYSLFKYMRKAR